MEVPRNHANKKKNTKATPPAINIGAGAGSFGMGGIVLFGGALVTATIVSAALAFKTRRQRRSPSDAIKRSRSQSPETQTVDAPNEPEFMINSKKDPEPSNDFRLDSQSDGVTSMKEMPIKPIQNSTQEEKKSYDEKMDSGDGTEIRSVVGEEQESYVDSDFESEELYEQVVVTAQSELGSPSSEEDSCGDSALRDDSGEEQKYSKPIDDENDEQIDPGPEKSLVPDEAVTMMEDDVADVSEEGNEEIQIRHVGVDQETVCVNEAAAMETACVNQVKEEDNSHVQFLEEERGKDGLDEMIPKNREGDLIDGTGHADQIDSEVATAEEAIHADFEHRIEEDDDDSQVQFREEKEKDCHDEIILENCVSNKTGSANQIMREERQQMEYTSEQEKEKEAAAACVDFENMEDISEMADHEVALDAQEMHEDEVHQTLSSGGHPLSAVACIMNLNDSLEVAGSEENSPRPLTNKEEKDKETEQKVEEQVSTEDELVNDEEKDEEGEIPDVQATEAEKVDDQPVEREDHPPLQLMGKEVKGEETAVEVQVKMGTEDEIVKKEEKNKEDGIPLVQLKKEDATLKNEVSSDGVGDVIGPMQDEPTPEAKIGNLKVEEKEENQRHLSKEQNDSNHNGIMEDKGSESVSSYREWVKMDLAKGKYQSPASEPWNLKLRTWSVLVSIWCLCHWYSELPFPELSLIGSCLFILILLGYQNRTTYLVKHE